MAHRMQVLVDEAEIRRMKRAAQRHGVSLAEWVRTSLRAALRESPEGSPDRKIAVVRAAARHSFPTGDIDQVLEEIERGYASGASE